MINRVLIRTKVVQMLYSYLLTQGEFKLAQLPENASRDKRFAHAMYIDLLLLAMRLSGTRLGAQNHTIACIDDNRYLPANRVNRMLRNDSDLKAAYLKSDFDSLYDDSLLAELHNAITHSSAYRSYIRLKNRELADDVKLWSTIFTTLFAKNANLLAAARKSELFSTSGFEQGIAMATEAVEQLGDISGAYIAAKNSLARSLDKAYELYHALLALPIELTRVEDQRLDAARHKHLATAEDLNPNTRFVDNGMVRILNGSEEMKQFFAEHPFSWNDDPQLVRSLLDKVVSSEIYATYMSAESSDLKADCDFWRNVYKNIILPSDELAEALENMSVYWNDDLDIVGTFVIKTMRRISDSPEGNFLLPQYKDEEDAAFGSELFVDTIEHIDEYRSLIDQFVDTRLWDSERLAFMDVVIMSTAISELLNYPAIPIAVTLNEYIEIANCYSSPKSGQFVNGILYSVVNYLKNEGKLTKN